MPDAIWLPPARQGDVYRAVTLLQPKSIALVDGYFQWVPAVWHKEILWAIHCGVHVFGAASMGALRAAELFPYGMHGVGRVFEAYRNGVLPPFREPFEDDDEVAVVHGPAECGYLAVSEAMVNIRVTLAEAERAQVIDAETRGRLIAVAKALFFPDRTYERILAQAGPAGIPAAHIVALAAWLPHGKVNQKRADALEMIQTVRAFLSTEPAPARCKFRFEYTTLWHRVVQELRDISPADAVDAQVLDELRLEGSRFLQQWDSVRESLLEPEPVETGKVEPRGEGLMAGEASLQELARARAVEQVRAEIPRLLVERHLLARLRHAGQYAKLLARAHDKRARLSGQAASHSVSELDELQLLQLEDWHFTNCLGAEIPDDISGYVSQLGYADMRAFHQAIFREYLYRDMLRRDTDASLEGTAVTARGQ